MDRPVIFAERLSKWYGPVLGISEVNLQIGGGVVGLLGENGAGKSTLIKLIAGLIRPANGRLEVFGEPPSTSPAARARIGYCPEHNGVYGDLSAVEMVALLAELSGIPRKEARPAAERALVTMGLQQAMHRKVKGFSMGMRQRTKLAQALCHDPDILLLDEPLTGVDPMARADIIARIRGLAEAGKTVILSSHVLAEIEALTQNIIVIYRGQVLAEGNLYAIRELIDKHPHRIRIECDRPRSLGQKMAGHDHVINVAFERDAVIIDTADPDRCYDGIADVALDEDVAIQSLTSPDNNLGAVFEYLTGGRSA